MVQAREDPDPMTLTALEEMRLVLAKKVAVSRPRTTLSTPGPY